MLWFIRFLITSQQLIYHCHCTGVSGKYGTVRFAASNIIWAVLPEMKKVTQTTVAKSWYMINLVSFFKIVDVTAGIAGMECLP